MQPPERNAPTFSPDKHNCMKALCCQPGTTIGLFLQTIIMEPVQEKKIESPAWQHPAPGNEQNDKAKTSVNASIKTGGNSRSAEDDLDLENNRIVTRNSMGMI
jgi:hypothetical protein